MSYLRQLVDMDAAMRATGTKAMSVTIAYSKAAEIAELADRALPEGWKAYDNDRYFVLTAPSGDEAIVYKQSASDDSSNDEFLRELAQELLKREDA